MKRILLLLTSLSALAATAQNIDTLAIQDFETVPATPTWTYTGTLSDLQTGYASPTSCIPNTPLGINGSTAWHVVAVSGGNPIVFDNQTIPATYDSIYISFRMQGLNLNGSTGGPDNLDYVLVEYSLDGGASYVARVRMRGAINNNSFWSYDAAGQAVVDYLPATEQVFQPVNSGLQMTEGISYVKIGFPGSITQLAVRITPRSSSSTDSWLVDNVLLTGVNQCTNTSNSVTTTTCDTYTGPSGTVYDSTGIYTDIIPNAAGCDSITTIDLTVITVDVSVTTSDPALTAGATGATYQWLDCDNNYAQLNGENGQSFTASVNGNFAVEVTENGCTDTSACYPIASTEILENTFKALKVYPNPTLGDLTLDLGALQNNISVSVINALGQTILTKTWAENEILQLTLNGSKGLYIIKIVSGEDVARIRVMKE